MDAACSSEWKMFYFGLQNISEEKKIKQSMVISSCMSSSPLTPNIEEFWGRKSNFSDVVSAEEGVTGLLSLGL